VTQHISIHMLPSLLKKLESPELTQLKSSILLVSRIFHPYPKLTLNPLFTLTGDGNFQMMKYFILDGHVGEGYGKSSVDLRQFCIQALNDSGIVLDRVYTGKSVFGLMKELKNNPNRFRGNKVMWVHTGGMFGFLDKSMDEDLEKFNPIKKNYFD